MRVKNYSDAAAIQTLGNYRRPFDSPADILLWVRHSPNSAAVQKLGNYRTPFKSPVDSPDRRIRESGLAAGELNGLQ